MNRRRQPSMTKSCVKVLLFGFCLLMGAAMSWAQTPTVTVTASDASAAEPSNTGTFTITRDNVTGTSLNVFFTMGGTAVNGADYTLSNSSFVTIPANQASATVVTLTPIDDGSKEPDETAILTISANAEYTVGSPSSATVTIGDNDNYTVTVTATDASAAEPSNTGTFTITRDNVTGTSLNVFFTMGGTAVNGADYTLSNSSFVTIPASQASATVTLTPVNDTTFEGDETAILTISANAEYTVGSPSSATVTIADDDALPTVTISASDPSASEAGPDPGTFTVSRAGGPTGALTVNYTVGGTASSGGDYTPLSGSVTIPSGSTSAPFSVTPIDDSEVESNETVVITLAASASYNIGTPGSATVTIADNDVALPAVTITATDPDASEQGLDPGTFTVTRSLVSASALVVQLTRSGSALSGVDYTISAGTTLTILANQASATITVTPINDALVETDETVVLTVAPDAAYTVGSPNNATVTIHSEDIAPTVTITATDPDASEQGADAGTFTVTRNPVNSNPLTVQLTRTGTAVSGVDYTISAGGTVGIPANQASATITVTPIDDSLVESDETVIVSIAPDAEYVVGSPNSATVTIADNDAALPTVTISATDPNASETGPDAGTLTVSRTGSTSAALTVNFTVSGTATSGSDYTPLGTSVTILAGSPSAAILVTPVDDSLFESSETVIATLASNANYTIGSPSSATVTITDNDLPTVTISATDPNASETGPDTGSLAVTRTGDTSAALMVNYTVGGTATSGSDYTPLAASVTIPSGSSSAAIIVTPIDDSLFEASETVIATLASSANYTIGSPSSATVTIADNDLPTVTISATDPNASETGPDTGTLAVTRTGDTSAALTVNYTVGGTATSGSDYTPLAASVTILSGSSSAAITVTPVDDSLVEGNETVVLTLASAAGYLIGAPNNATVTIADNDVALPTVTISATDASAAEAGPDTGTFTVSRTGATTAALTVNYTVGGTATSGSDYTALSGSVTLDIGFASAPLTLTPVDDTAVESSETVVVTLAASALYNIGSPSSATVTIVDNDVDLPTVSISATDPNASETGPDSGTFTITHSGSASAALTVSYTVSGTATNGSDYTALSGAVTIPAGSSFAAIAVVPLDDSLTEPAETVIATLSPGSAYTVGSPGSATVTIADKSSTAEPPAITKINPSSATAGGPAFTLTVLGTNFQSGAVVQWNGADRPTQFLSSTQLTASIPASDIATAGAAQVRVSQAGVTSNTVNFAITESSGGAPELTQVLPKFGPTVGHSKVLVLGSKFVQGAQILLGGVPLTDVLFITDRLLLGIAGPHAAGTVDAEIIQPNGTARLNDAFTYKELLKLKPPLPTGARAPVMRIPFIVDTPEFRTNIGINNLDGEIATITLTLVDNNGLVLAEKSITVPARGMRQINNVAQFMEDEASLTGREAYLLLDSTSNVRAWASQIDNVSKDPSMQLARPTAAGRILLPSSVSNSRFLTSLLITSDSSIDGQVNILLRDTEGEILAQLNNQALPAFGYLFFEDFYKTLGLDNAFGPIEIEGVGGIQLVATERIYTRENTSAYFEGVDGSKGSKKIVLPYAVDSAAFRTNLGVNNLSSAPANALVSFLDKDGLVKGSLNVLVPAKGLRQLNHVIRQLLQREDLTHLEGTLLLEADQEIAAWTSQIDNVTQDPSLFVGKVISGTRLLIPSTTSVGSFKSSLVVVNLDDAPTQVEYKLRDSEGNLIASGSEVISGRGFFSSPNIHAHLGIPGNFGPLEITSLSNKPLLVVSRVYSDQGTGGYFEGLP